MNCLYWQFVGHSVCCLVHGFEPYFYISCPPGMGPDDISRFQQTLEVFVFTTSLGYKIALIELLLNGFNYIVSGEDEGVEQK